MLSPRSSRDDAIAIWQSAVDAVRSDRLVRNAVECHDGVLTICGQRFPLDAIGRILVVGAGKAGAGMATAMEEVLGTELLDAKVTGWVNVPADCVKPLRTIHLHAGRPAGVNEPTAEGLAGTEQILNLVAQLQPDDLCIVLISGGGSALLPAPRPPLTLDDLQAVTRFLMASGASIQEMNLVRRRLSRIAGGGLLRVTRAKHVVALILSDVVGDPLEVIASGPTVADPTTDAEAIDVLRRFSPMAAEVPPSVFACLEAGVPMNEPNIFATNHILGRNATAVAAAVTTAEALGYHAASLGSEHCGEANHEGRDLALRCRSLRDTGDLRGRGTCLISGGEPVVDFRQSKGPGKGGRNQQFVLAGLCALLEDATGEKALDRIVLLSGGTDGEDGPTDAAGAWVDKEVAAAMCQKGIDPVAYRDRHDAYRFFEQTGGLLMTGPTHTNVMDVRVAIVEKRRA